MATMRASRRSGASCTRQRAEVVVSGHDHDYERFALQAPDGRSAPGRGIRQFVVGTGGAPLRRFRVSPADHSQVRNNRTHGILRLRLAATSYSWRFLAVKGGTFTDSGRGSCH
jgi:hypothetical protein